VVAERLTLRFSTVVTLLYAGLLYPIVCHLAWSDGGWASPFRAKELIFDCGFVDFAGSLVVHVNAGVVAINRKAGTIGEAEFQRREWAGCEDRPQGGKSAASKKHVSSAGVGKKTGSGGRR
jgi:ammonia channel protein AmtB